LNEIETKILDIDVDDIRRKAKEINAPMVKSENQINKIFDFPDKRLVSSKGYARIRIVENLLDNSFHYYMTTKKILSQDKFKIMQENETEILDAKSGESILNSLGLELIESVKKYRESYKYKNTLIEIDINDKTFCPFPYIEIESQNEKELEEVISLLGYTMDQTSSKSIYEITGKA
jgi:adenylate cyclase, class 2